MTLVANNRGRRGEIPHRVNIVFTRMLMEKGFLATVGDDLESWWVC
jgi:hypothetical protein